MEAIGGFLVFHGLRCNPDQFQTKWQDKFGWLQALAIVRHIVMRPARS
jgi:hypothetical protein